MPHLLSRVSSGRGFAPLLVASALAVIVLLGPGTRRTPRVDVQAAPEQTEQPSQLRRFLQSYLAGLGAGPDESTRVIAATIESAPHGQVTVVYVAGPNWCGSGGCLLLLLGHSGSSFRVLGKTTIVQLPITRIRTDEHGMPVLGVVVEGGGIRPGYVAALSFSGNAYPANPTIPPATPLEHGANRGCVLIPQDAEPVPLYPPGKAPLASSDSIYARGTCTPS